MEPIVARPRTSATLPAVLYSASAPEPDAAATTARQPSAPAPQNPGRDKDSMEAPRREPAGSVVTPPVAYYLASRKIEKLGRGAKDETFKKLFDEQSKALTEARADKLKAAEAHAGRDKLCYIKKRTPEAKAAALKKATTKHNDAIKSESTARATRLAKQQVPAGQRAMQYGKTGAIWAAGWTAIVSGASNFKQLKAGKKTAGTAALDWAQDAAIAGVAGAVAGATVGVLGNIGAKMPARIAAFVVGYFGSSAVSALTAEGLDRLALKARGIPTQSA